MKRLIVSRRLQILSGLLVTAMIVSACESQAAPGVTTVPPGVDAFRDLNYVEGSTDPAQTLDLYVPQNSPKPLPLLIYIHGGAWTGGDKKSCPPLLFVNDGYAAASLEYRFSNKAKFPAQIQDCQAAIRFLRGNAKKYNLDVDHFGVGGESAGGHLAALIGTSGGTHAFAPIGGYLDQSDRVQAVCDLFGPANFMTVIQQGNANAEKHLPKWEQWQGGRGYSVLIGAETGVDVEKSEAVSPIHYVSKSTPPFLIYHGTYDQLVPFAQSEELAAKLKENGVEVLLQPFANMEHSGPIYWTPPALKLVKAFFDKHLQGRDVPLEPLSEKDSTYVPAK
jgi:acetyl esterase/lipase